MCIKAGKTTANVKLVDTFLLIVIALVLLLLTITGCAPYGMTKIDYRLQLESQWSETNCPSLPR